MTETDPKPGEETFLQSLGLTLRQWPAVLPATIRRDRFSGLPVVEVQSVRMASRIGRRGQAEREYVVELTQSRDGYLDREDQRLADSGLGTGALRRWQARNPGRPASEFRGDFQYRCGVTLLIDTKSFRVRRVIRTRYRVEDEAGLERLRRHLEGASKTAMNAFDDPGETGGSSNAFADLHRHVERGFF